MAISTIPAASAASKTRYIEQLSSGTSYTVPAGVTYVNVTLVGGGGSGASGNNSSTGNPGASVVSNLTTTPGGSIAYAIGAGGAQGSSNTSGNDGGTTTFTGATSAVGGNKGARDETVKAGTPTFANNAGAQAFNSAYAGGAGGAGYIIVEYWK